MGKQPQNNKQAHFDIEKITFQCVSSCEKKWNENIEVSDIAPRAVTGTKIWWRSSGQAPKHCIKEFFLANPETYSRQIPDPGLQLPSSQWPLSGSRRGLSSKRAELFDKLQNGVLQQEVQTQGAHNHQGFRNQFNVYSFELEALITQFIKHYGLNKLVQSYFWGAIQFPKREGLRFAIEMEKLEELPPPAPHAYLEILHRLLDMLLAVTQLHSMLIPTRCYPPELIRDLNFVKKHPLTRPFHYDLSPDQFMLRKKNGQSEVVLIDFNATRMEQSEYSSFSWASILGKDYYRPPERRSANNVDYSFQSKPVYDLYALMSTLLFYLSRETPKQQKIKDIIGWEDPNSFYQFIHSPDFAQKLSQKLPKNRGFQTKELIALIEAVFIKDSKQRESVLSQLPHLDWKGESDWMLLPKAMNYIAGQVLQRKFKAVWKNPTLQLEKDSPSLSIEDLFDRSSSKWDAGPWEEGRISFPDFKKEEIFFFQKEQIPLVRHGRLYPDQLGDLTIFACFGGCIDFENPLKISVRSESIPHTSIRAEKAPLQPVPVKAEHSSPQSFGEGTQGILLGADNPSQTIVREPEFSSSQLAVQATLSHTPSIESKMLGITVQGSVPQNPSKTIDVKSQILFQETNTSYQPLRKEETRPPQPKKSYWDEFIEEAKESSDLNRLLALEAMAKKMTNDNDVLTFLVNIRSRRCILLLQKNKLGIKSPALKGLSDLANVLEKKDLPQGLLLNNLAICSYQSALQGGQLPTWKSLFGFDPCKKLEEWLYRTDPENVTRTSQRFYEIRERARETISYCHKIKRRLNA